MPRKKNKQDTSFAFYVGRTIKVLAKIILFFGLFSVLIVIAVKWFNPPVTAFIQNNESINMYLFHKNDYKQEWVSIEKISRHLLLAVIASEDQRFLDHFGFDFKEIKNAINELERGKRVRGASTITQQTAKNLFLWPGKDFVRKGLEAYYTLIIELLWSKKRILEVYLNAAEFGKNIYGAEAAAKYYFNKSAIQLNQGECALLAAIMPNPKRYNPLKPTEYLLNRKNRILKQMSNLGGIQYLNYLFN